MNILSLFDGISCAQLALNKANIEYDNYFASEIDKNAISITNRNYPDTVQLGDVSKIDLDELPKIDILFGGSPCQDLSMQGNSRAGRSGIYGKKSKLFWDFVRVYRKLEPKAYLFENVASMSDENKIIITRQFGSYFKRINSNLFVPQKRNRLYWTNIKVPRLPRKKDREVDLQDILETNRKKLKRYKVPKTSSTQALWYGGDSKDITNSLESECVTTQRGGWRNVGLIEFEDFCRWTTEKECERLQGLPDNYTRLGESNERISSCQRHKAIGNGWTIDVISHILKGLKKHIREKNGKMVVVKKRRKTLF